MLNVDTHLCLPFYFLYSVLYPDGLYGSELYVSPWLWHLGFNDPNCVLLLGIQWVGEGEETLILWVLQGQGM